MIQDLKPLMEAYGYTYEYLSERMHVNLNRVVNLVRGCDHYTYEELRKLCEVFNLSEDVLTSDPKSDIKLLFFDYDNVLVAHDPEITHLDDSYEARIRRYFEHPDMYADDKLVKPVVAYIDSQIAHDVTCICLAQQSSNIRDCDIMQSLNGWFPRGVLYYTTDTSWHKIDFIRAYAYSHDIPMCNITLLDSRADIVQAIRKHGAHSLSPAQILFKED